MPKFQWEATTRAGEVRRGVVEAADEAAVQNRLRADQLTPRKIKKQATSIQISIGSPVKPKELQVFTRQLATMIDAGLPLVQCLDILANQSREPDLPGSPSRSSPRSSRARPSATRCASTPRSSTTCYVNLVGAGEVGGILDTILNRLALYIEKAVKLKAPGQERDGLPDRDHGGRRSASSR
jgi:type IV pilus assembly protein PilC